MAAYAFQINVEGNAITGMKQIESEASNLKTKVANASESMGKSFTSSIGNIANQLKGLVAGFAAFEGVKSFLKLGSDMQQTNIAFEVMLGSAEKDKK